MQAEEAQKYPKHMVRICESGKSYDLLPLCDAQLRTDDGCIVDIHRMILVRSSNYFGAMFCDMDRDKREFLIPGISGECLSHIVSYFYTGDIEVTETNVKDIMIAADYLLLNDRYMKNIKKSIIRNMTELTCLGIIQAARQINDEDIFQESFRFIQMRFEELVRSQKDELADLPLEIFKTILINRSLFVYNEATVWQAIVEWTQKDIPSRRCYVPQLLLTLAIEDIGEELATEILQHEIISKNSFMKDLNEIRSKDFPSNLDVISTFLRSHSNPFAQPYRHRIPLNLHVISFSSGGEGEDKKSTLYITYDENTDLWRKVTEVSFLPDFLIEIGHNIYIFRKEECMKFDLSVMDWVRMEKSMHAYKRGTPISAVAMDTYIYILSKHSDRRTYGVEIYDTVNNRWFNGVSPINIHYGLSVAIGKKIYLVGHTPLENWNNFLGMTTQMFDPVTQQWSHLSAPDDPFSRNRSRFALVAYHRKIYLLGGINEEDVLLSTAEVFDPDTNLWEALPNLPYTYSLTKAVVFNDQIIVYEGDRGDYESNKKRVRWNDATECWEKLKKTENPKDLRRHRFYSIDDVDTIRLITKQHRDPETQMEKSHFN